MRNALVMLLVGWACVVATGCVVVGAMREGLVWPPSAEVVGVSVVDATTEGVAVEARVLLTNPNPVELPVAWVRVRFVGPGGTAFFAEALPTVSMPPEGERVLTVRGALPVRGGQSGADDGYSATVVLGWVPPGEVREILTESGVPLPVALARGE